MRQRRKCWATGWALAGVVALPVTLASCAGDAQQRAVTDEDKAVISRLYGAATAELAEPPQERLARAHERQGKPSHAVAEEMSRPDAQVYSRQAEVADRNEQRLDSGEIRSCGRWTIRYNTGPESVQDMCWDVKIEGNEVTSARPYGTDQMNRTKAGVPGTPGGQVTAGTDLPAGSAS